MIHTEIEVPIFRPVEQVFSFVTDIKNMPFWLGSISDIRSMDGKPMGAGANFHIVGERMGQKKEAELRVESYMANKLISYLVKTGPVKLEIQIQFNPTRNGTLLLISMKAESTGLLKIVAGPVQTQLKNQMGSGFTNIKSILESNPGQ